jgi:rod shape-determining protein MreC
VIAFLIACVGLLIAGPRIQPVASVLSPIFVPIESTVSGVADDVGAFVGSLTKLPTLERQNRALQREIALLQEQVALDPLVRKELRELNREVGFRDLNPHLDLLSSRVLYLGTTGLSPSVTVAAGSNNGVRVGNPVLDPNGYVIGKVTQVWLAGATVGLLTAPDINIPALDSRTGARGLADTPAGGSPRLDLVVAGQKLHAGDYVVTSGLMNEFPIGLLIGQIQSVSGGNVQSFRSAPIRTAGDLNNPEYVQIVLNFGPGTNARYSRNGRRLP